MTYLLQIILSRKEPGKLRFLWFHVLSFNHSTTSSTILLQNFHLSCSIHSPNSLWGYLPSLLFSYPERKRCFLQPLQCPLWDIQPECHHLLAGRRSCLPVKRPLCVHQAHHQVLMFHQSSIWVRGGEVSGLKYILTKYAILRTTFHLFSTFEVSVYFYVGIHNTFPENFSSSSKK